MKRLEANYSSLPSEPIRSEAPRGSNNGNLHRKHTGGRNLWVFCAVLITQSIIILALLAKQRKLAAALSECPANLLYSPANVAIEYMPKTFTMGFADDDLTIYQGPPSNETDDAWEALYEDLAYSQITKDEARLLPNRTAAIPADPENYAIGLAVFHQIHCLNMIRKGLPAAGNYYYDYDQGTLAKIPIDMYDRHVSHCLDNLRQSAMCASDVTPVVWQWNDERQRSFLRMDTVHSCRNFDKISDWAVEHKRQSDFDFFVHVPDDIVIPKI